YRRGEYACLHQGHGRDQGLDPDLPATAPAGDQGPRPRPLPLLRPACDDPTLAQDRDAGAEQRMEAEPGGPREARRTLRMHTVLLLIHLLSVILVETGPLSLFFFSSRRRHT